MLSRFRGQICTAFLCCLLGAAQSAEVRLTVDDTDGEERPSIEFLNHEQGAGCTMSMQNGAEGAPSLRSDCTSRRLGSTPNGRLVISGGVDKEPTIEFRHSSGATCHLFMQVDEALEVLDFHDHSRAKQ